MFDIGWQELFIVSILAVVVVGPKELPRVLRTVMGIVRKARMMARDFQDGLDDVVREADLEDMKKQVSGLADGDLGKSVEDALDPNGDIAKELDMTEIQDDIGKMATESSTPEQLDAEAEAKEKTSKEERKLKKKKEWRGKTLKEKVRYILIGR